MKKRILTFILVLVITAALSGFTGTVSASWADEMMSDLVDKGILDTIPADPAEYITREDFSVMLAKAMLTRQSESLTLGSPGGSSVFEDAGSIKSENLPYIMYLYNNKILLGSLIDGKIYMQPDAFITRQDTMTLLGRWLDLDPTRYVRPSIIFSDNDAIATYARALVNQLSNMKIVTGYLDGSFQPRRNISCAEVSSLLYKILHDRVLVTYFGDGNLGNADGISSDARFAIPSGLCLDRTGNLIVFDTFNAVIKRISNELAVTILGSSEYVDDYGFAMPYYLDGTREEALFGRPVDGVYAPNGDLFIVDRENHAIRLLRDNRVYTFAGGIQGYSDGRAGSASFDFPSAIAIDNAGNLYVADTMNHCIRMITTNGTVSTIAGRPGVQGYSDGAAGSALFNEPSGIAVDRSGAIYVADTGNHVIRRISGSTVTTAAGVVNALEAGEDYRPGGYENGQARSSQFKFPTGLFFTEGVLFIADTGNHAVRALTSDGYVITVAGSGEEPGDADGPPGIAMMNSPTGVVYVNGFLYIADSLNNKIRTVSLDLTSFD